MVVGGHGEPRAGIPAVFSSAAIRRWLNPLDDARDRGVLVFVDDQADAVVGHWFP